MQLVMVLTIQNTSGMLIHLLTQHFPGTEFSVILKGLTAAQQN